MNLKRILALVLAIGLPSVAVAATLLPLLQPGLPGPAESALRQYLERRAVQAEAVTPAEQPGVFQPEMSAASYGAGGYFRTTDSYRPALAAPTAQAGSADPGSLRALPYPPEDLWCARVSGAEAADGRVIYIALHQDLYRAEWVIHEAAAEARPLDLAAQLAQVGCRLNR